MFNIPLDTGTENTRDISLRPGAKRPSRVPKTPLDAKKNTILVAFKAIREQKHLGLWDFGVPRNTDGNVPKTPFQGTKSERSPYDP